MTRPQTRGDECDCCDELRDRVDEHDRFFVDVRGIHGTNGKLGTLKGRADESDSRRAQLVAWLLGILLTVIAAAVTFGVWLGRIDADVETLKQRFRAGSGSEERHSP